MLAVLAGVILLLGAGFLYAYDTLRSNRVDFSTPAQASTRVLGESAPEPMATDDDYRALSELGIDPDDNNLSPQARAAIIRAHRAAQAAGANAAAADDGADQPMDDLSTLPEEGELLPEGPAGSDGL